MNHNIRKIFLTLFYVGLIKKAPGTFGSIVSLFIALLLLQYLSLSNLFMLCVLITIISVKQINIYEKYTKQHDNKEIVIDELVGMWLTLIIANINIDNMIYIAPLSLIFFRIFDIYKPSIIGKIDKKTQGGWGVMADDIVAAIFAGICTSGTFKLIQNFIL